MKKEIKEVARQKIGEYLKSLREEKVISTYQYLLIRMLHDAEIGTYSGRKNEDIARFIQDMRIV